MKVVFNSKKLEQLYANPDLWKWYYPKWVVESFSKVITLMYTVDTVTKLNIYGKYKVSQKKWDMKWIWAARLNDSRRLEFTIGKDGGIQVANIERISNHYE